MNLNFLFTILSTNKTIEVYYIYPSSIMSFEISEMVFLKRNIFWNIYYLIVSYSKNSKYYETLKLKLTSSEVMS